MQNNYRIITRITQMQHLLEKTEFKLLLETYLADNLPIPIVNYTPPAVEKTSFTETTSIKTHASRMRSIADNLRQAVQK